ncbi:TetR/AcrR family transcriptional regulator [Paenibacillus sp. y28]|uniref:TetR/AcrR family transcriptional regulator n=1 Tax=Paenibacillus sp. y28 TaxID=3129110 RepID=UPI003018840C
MPDYETRDKIMNAAQKIFAEKGLHVAKVSDIVKEAGVAQGTFYLYFKNKEELFQAIVDTNFEEMNGVFERLRGLPETACSPKIVREHLYGIFTELLLNFYQNKGLHTMMHMHGINSEKVDNVCNLFHKRLSSLISAELRRFGYAPGYSEEQMEVATFAVMGMFQEVAFQWFIERGAKDTVIPGLAEVLTDMLLWLLVGEEAARLGAAGCQNSVEMTD